MPCQRGMKNDVVLSILCCYSEFTSECISILSGGVYMKKVLILAGILLSGIAVASQQAGGPANEAFQSSGKKAHKNLWLTDKKVDSVVTISLSSYTGLVRHFLATGLYDASVFAKGFALIVGSPSCNRCVPHGFFSAIDIEGYFNQSPIWIGVRGLGGGFGMHKHFEAQAPLPNDNDAARSRALLMIKQPVTAIILSPSYALGATFGGALGGVDMNVSIEPVGLALNGSREIPTSHVRLSADLYGYTAPLRYKSLAARLFVGGQASHTFPGENLEYQLTVAPGSALVGMLGFQGALSFIRFGSAYQCLWQSGSSEMPIDVMTYSFPVRSVTGINRHRDAFYNTQQSAAGPFSPAMSSVQHVMTSYLAATVGQCTVGLSSQNEFRDGQVTPRGSLRVTASVAF